LYVFLQGLPASFTPRRWKIFKTPIAPPEGNGYTSLSCASENQEGYGMSKEPYDTMDLKALLCLRIPTQSGH
jgi:hypothetical protein